MPDAGLVNPLSEKTTDVEAAMEQPAGSCAFIKYETPLPMTTFDVVQVPVKPDIAVKVDDVGIGKAAEFGNSM